MAASGSLKTTAYDNRYLEFSWSEKSQSVETNKTVISYTLKGAGSRTGYYQARNIKLVIDGQTVYTFGGGSGSYVKLYEGTVVTSGEFTIVHDADGTRDFTVTVEAGIYVWAVNCTGSGEFTLNTIPRASTLTAYNGSLNAEHTLTINSASPKFKHRLTYRCGDVAAYILGDLNTSVGNVTAVKWTPPIGLAHENTTGTSVTVTLTLYTYTADDTHVGTTTKVITCAIPVTVAPSCSFTWKDITGAADLYGNLVQGISKLEIQVKGVTSYSSPIALYTVTANGVQYTGAEVTTEVLKKSGQHKISAMVKDQRGRTGGSGQTQTVLAYTAPVVSKLAVHRCNEDGTENDQGNFVKATFSAAITNLAGKNPTVYVLKYKPNGSNQYTEVELTELANTYNVTDFSYIFAADGNLTYEVEVTATDNHGTANRATSVSTAFTLLNWHPSGTGMGVGRVSQKENTLEVAIAAEFHGPLVQLGNRHTAFVPEDNENASAAGYDLMARITVVAAYANYPLTFVFSRRWATMPMTVHFTLDNTDHLDPGVVSMGFEGEDYGAYLVHSSASVWDLYVARKSNWDIITLNTWHTAQAMDHRVELTFPCEFASSLPAGATKVTAAAARSLLDFIYPVGSIYLAYHATSPATLFGGTWERISARVLRAAGGSDTIGSEGGLADGGERTYINIAVWRRTA